MIITEINASGKSIRPAACNPLAPVLSIADPCAVVNPPDTSQLLVAFDGECMMCSRTVRFLAKRDRYDNLRFTPLQGERGAEMLERFGEEPPDSILVRRGGEIMARSRGAIAIARALPQPWPFLAGVAALIPRPIRDAAYDFIARHRTEWFGKGNACAMPDEELQRRLQ